MEKSTKNRTLKKPDYYSEEFKWQVVQDVLFGRLTKEAARRAYNISGNCTILYWMRKFSGIDDYRAGGQPVTDLSCMSKNKKEIELQERIKHLEVELRREKLRADLWQKMVEVAEEDLKVPIEKKYGAKQLTDSSQKGEEK
ncbi:hypothetical protein OB69_18150 [Roseivirga seohaensis subsp. aquiponti]|uniref:Transposase n=1 Tax=Roseivirga seohaensis subsp. aquiponti TaxID=1566026 RepID=A0A0L8AG12_9BACT|nr:hypothetical protein [Roseivirga seohaensis]KOF01333.1 hypothetical protein OB69_18150 [Roseivirga seohaensis subsp. aquiponti]